MPETQGGAAGAGLHEFGGVSTDLKLSRVGEYLRGFTTALRRKIPQLWYIDAFAGSGQRTVRRDAAKGDLVTPPQAERVEQRRGSARIAIDTQPGFDRMIFIERKRKFCRALEQLKAEHPGRDIEVRNEDGNEAVLKVLREADWRSTRAVLFLDPYGMHVSWSTLEAVRATEAIDLWYFVSLAGLFRQAAINEGKLTEDKRQALTRMLGTDEWEQAWYGEEARLPGLDLEPIKSRQRGVDRLEAYFGKRLGGLFPKVLPPRRFYNHRGTPMFSLFFAVSNPDPRAIAPASRIATHILKSGSSSHVLPR